jgi:hypothetical protein
MASTINASSAGSGGLITTGDDSGDLALQSNGVTQATVTSTGLSLASTASINALNTFGFENRIINGNMTIDQRNAGASVTLSGPAATYLVDRWNVYASAASKLSFQQNAGSVTPPAGFTNYLGITSLSAYSVGATDEFLLRQPIEGYNVADLGFGAAGASTVTLSFWVRSSLTGSFGASIQNSNGNRSYPFSYTISVANTWEQKTVTIAGDTTGTWLKTNGIGLNVNFGLGVGSTYGSGTAGAWVGAIADVPTGSVSVVGTSGATFYITGVSLEKGSTATAFDYRPYGTELALCQRYYYRIAAGTAGQIFGSGFNLTTTLAAVIVPFPVQMRTAPSALEQTGTATDYRVNNLNTATTCSSVPTFSATTANVAYVSFTTGATLTAGQGCAGSCPNTSAYLGWSAEL